MKNIIFAFFSLFIASCSNSSTLDGWKGRIKQSSYTKDVKYIDGRMNREVHTEFFLKKEDMTSQVGFCVVSAKNNMLSIHTCYNTGYNSYYIDNIEQLKLLEYSLDYISNKLKDDRLVNMEFSVKDFGLAGIDISNEYKQKLKIDDDGIFMRPNDLRFITNNAFYLNVLELLHKYGYVVRDIARNDFYPVQATELITEHFLPDTCNKCTVIWDGIIVLKTNNIK